MTDACHQSALPVEHYENTVPSKRSKHTRIQLMRFDLRGPLALEIALDGLERFGLRAAEGVAVEAGRVLEGIWLAREAGDKDVNAHHGAFARAVHIAKADLWVIKCVDVVEDVQRRLEVQLAEAMAVVINVREGHVFHALGGQELLQGPYGCISAAAACEDAQLPRAAATGHRLALQGRKAHEIKGGPVSKD